MAITWGWSEAWFSPARSTRRGYVGPYPSPAPGSSLKDRLANTHPQGGKQVLKAFSGQMTNLWEVEGWAGPVASVVNSTPLYTNYRVLTVSLPVSVASAPEQLALQASQPHPLARKP